MTDIKTKASPQDFFLNLLSIVTLYISATSFGALLFQYVNHFFPDPARYFDSGNDRSIQFAVASLIVFFPVYLISLRYLNRDKSAKNTRIYKWLAYFTLFAAILLILGDVVAVVFQLFGGDLTIRFFLKALIIFLIGGSVLGYYLRDARGHALTGVVRNLFYALIAFVAVAIVGSFIIAGTPQYQRDKIFDAQRAQDMQNIQFEIVRFWQAKDRLPSGLTELEDDISGFRVSVDPETKEPYGYETLGELSFRICGTFTTASDDDELDRFAYPVTLNGSWEHDIGYTCFERDIDPELHGVDSLNVPKPIRL